MSEKLDIKEIERRAQKAYYQDGLLEIILGLYLAFVGSLLIANLKLVPFTVFLVFILKPAWDRLKEYFTFPRIGYVNFPEDPEGAKGILKGLLIFFLAAGGSALVLAVLLGSERGLDLWIKRLIPALVGVLLACGPVYAAGTFGLKHWYLIAGLFVFGGVAAPFLGLETVYATIGLQMLGVGVLVLLMGGVMLWGFLRTHPRLEQEVKHAGG